jgi:competence protein ComEC
VLAFSAVSIPNSNLEIIAFDVQNADAFLIKTPSNKYFMIDTGRSGYKDSRSQAHYIMLKYMKDRGIKNLEGLIITHFDNDHSGGAVDLIENLEVKQVYVNSLEHESYTSHKIYVSMEKRGQNHTLAQNNNTIYEEKDLRIKTFALPHTGGSDHDNEASIITLLSHKDFDMLFMGDAGVNAFNSLKGDIARNVEILKVGHHGGPHVVENKMLEHLGSSVSLISTGPNAYGHPNRGTLDTLRKTDIYRTDHHNSVRIIADGKSYTVFTYDPVRHKYVVAKKYLLHK